jgi:hypothetical protein
MENPERYVLLCIPLSNSSMCYRCNVPSAAVERAWWRASATSLSNAILIDENSMFQGSMC